MHRKTIIASIGLALILVACAVVWYLTSRQSPVASPEPSAISRPSAEALAKADEPSAKEEPRAKLVYVGTNETLSEALYNLDLQDGKLDHPYVVHRILWKDPESAFSKEQLTFIGKNGRIIRERIFESRKSKMDINIDSSGKHATVKYDYGRMGDVWSKDYYDVDGELLFSKKNTDYDYFIMKDGKTYERIRFLYMDEIAPEIALANQRGEEIGKYQIDKEGNKWLYYGGSDDSGNGEYIVYNLKYGQKINRLYCFNKNLDLIFKKAINGYDVLIIGVTNDGKSVVFVSSAERGAETVILDKYAKEMPAIRGYRAEVISSDQKEIILSSIDGAKIMILNMADFKQTIIDANKLGVQGKIRTISRYNNIIYVSSIIKNLNDYWTYFYSIDVDARSINEVFKKKTEVLNYIDSYADMTIKRDKLIIYDPDRQPSPYIYVFDIK